jgi:hypothetical protein
MKTKEKKKKNKKKKKKKIYFTNFDIEGIFSRQFSRILIVGIITG